MIDLRPAPVPDLDDEWIASHRSALAAALTHRRHRPVKWVALAGSTGVAATVSTLVLIGGSEQYAFAGWSADPTPPASGQLSAAESVCQARLAQAAQLPSDGNPVVHLPTNSNKAQDFASAAPDVASFVPELTDVRGPYTLTVLGDGTHGALCISAPNAVSLRWISGASAPVGPGVIGVDQVSLLARDGEPYTLVVGHAGAGVTGVTLTLGDGENVTASSGGGIFVAWWPGSETMVSAAVVTSNGTSTQPLNLPGPPLPPAGTKSPPSTPGT